MLKGPETEREYRGNPASSKCWKQPTPLGCGVQRGEKDLEPRSSGRVTSALRVSQGPGAGFLDRETKAQSGDNGFAQNSDDIHVVLLYQSPCRLSLTPPTNPKRLA